MILSQDNRGASAARNCALAVAQGTYVQFLDADDILAPDKLARQLEGADRGDDSRTLITCAWGRFHSYPTYATFAPDALWQDLTPADWIVSKFLCNAFMSDNSCLVSRRLSQLAGPWNEQLTLDDDGEYMCRLVSKSVLVRFAGNAKCYYRMGNIGSQSWNKSESALRSQLLSLELCIDHLMSCEDSERTRHASISFLQDNLHLFYPEHAALVLRARKLARQLGGGLVAPTERRRFRWLRRVVGARNAKRLRGRFNHLKLLARRTRGML